MSYKNFLMFRSKVTVSTILLENAFDTAQLAARKSKKTESNNAE